MFSWLDSPSSSGFSAVGASESVSDALHEYVLVPDGIKCVAQKKTFEKNRTDLHLTTMSRFPASAGTFVREAKELKQQEFRCTNQPLAGSKAVC